MIRLNEKFVLFFFWLYFHLSWVAIVALGRNNDNQWSLALILPAIVYHLINRQKLGLSILKALPFLLAGIVFDNFANAMGLITFTPSVEFPKIPIWLLSLWLLYFSYIPILATTLKGRWKLAFMLGAVLGPTSYLSGSHFALLTMNGPFAIFCYSIFWGIHFSLTARILWK